LHIIWTRLFKNCVYVILGAICSILLASVVVGVGSWFALFTNNIIVNNTIDWIFRIAFIIEILSVMFTTNLSENI
jgi:hypothetical protein